MLTWRKWLSLASQTSSSSKLGSSHLIGEWRLQSGARVSSKISGNCQGHPWGRQRYRPYSVPMHQQFTVTSRMTTFIAPLPQNFETSELFGLSAQTINEQDHCLNSSWQATAVVIQMGSKVPVKRNKNKEERSMTRN